MDKKCKFCSQDFYRANQAWCDANCEKVNGAVETLRHHNEWMRGNIEIMQPPKRIGEAIEMLLGAFEK